MNDQSAHVPSLTRRRAIASVTALALISATSGSALGSQVTATPAANEEDAIDALMPDWRFSLVESQDPYLGEIADVLPGTRLVAFEVIVANMSDQPLEVKPNDFVVRDDQGIEYAAGDFRGVEPRIVNQILANAERTRGWVWFGVPFDAVINEIVYVAPKPLLRVTLP